MNIVFVLGLDFLLVLLAPHRVRRCHLLYSLLVVSGQVVWSLFFYVVHILVFFKHSGFIFPMSLLNSNPLLSICIPTLIEQSHNYLMLLVMIGLNIFDQYPHCILLSNSLFLILMFIFDNIVSVLFIYYHASHTFHGVQIYNLTFHCNMLVYKSKGV